MLKYSQSMVKCAKIERNVPLVLRKQFFIRESAFSKQFHARESAFSKQFHRLCENCFEKADSRIKNCFEDTHSRVQCCVHKAVSRAHLKSMSLCIALLKHFSSFQFNVITVVQDAVIGQLNCALDRGFKNCVQERGYLPLLTVSKDAVI